MGGIIPAQPVHNSIALLLVRLVAGSAFIFHGMQKISHPFDWIQMGPLVGTPAWLQAAAAGAEFFGGILLLVGFLTPLVAFGIGCDMLVALFFVHIATGGPFVGGQRAFEPPLLYLIIMVGFLFMGPGTYSLDHLLFKRRRTPLPAESGAEVPV